MASAILVIACRLEVGLLAVTRRRHGTSRMCWMVRASVVKSIGTAGINSSRQRGTTAGSGGCGIIRRSSWTIACRQHVSACLSLDTVVVPHPAGRKCCGNRWLRVALTFCHACWLTTFAAASTRCGACAARSHHCLARIRKVLVVSSISATL